MKHYSQVLIWLTIILLSFQTILSCHENNPVIKPADSVKSTVQNHVTDFRTWLTNEWMPLINNKTDKETLQASFLKGRNFYKNFEWGLEYFFPTTAKNINGAPLPEIEAEEHTVIDPMGLQVIEELLFVDDTLELSRVIDESRKLQSLALRAGDLWEGLQLRNDQVFDALRMELARMITLGISGFDTPASFAGITEIEPVLNSIVEILEIYMNNDLTDSLNIKIENITSAAKLFALNASSFDSFNRMHFITQFINPLSKTILLLQHQLKIPLLNGVGALRNNAGTIFDEQALNVNYFTPDINSWITKDKINIGKQLFFDPILSNNNKISCASCHKPELAFTDGLPKSKATGSTGFLARNTPTLINAGFQQGQFYDLRAAFLEDQIRDVIQNRDEIHGDLEKSAKKIAATPAYQNLIKKTFPGIKEFTSTHLQVLLSSYIRSLSAFNSPFDLYMRGDYTQMNKDEIAGFNLFMGKAKCGTCHFMPLFNGTVPPDFNNTESEVIGAPADKSNTKLDTDKGRYEIYQIPEYLFSFKTPTIRNVALTGPYMHNGVFKTLDEVITFYDEGGGKGLGLEVPNQTLPDDKLNLTDNEKKQIILFMQSLTDTLIAN